MTTDNRVTLRQTVADDLDVLFTFQLDLDANYLAAFTAEDPTDKAAFLHKYSKLLHDRTVHMMTIIVNNFIAGSLAKFESESGAEITFWIDKKSWGQGIATEALKKFLTVENTRPLFGRVVFDNLGSQRVLEKCGFVKIGKDKGFANARQTEVEESIYRLT